MRVTELKHSHENPPLHWYQGPSSGLADEANKEKERKDQTFVQHLLCSKD